MLSDDLQNHKDFAAPMVPAYDDVLDIEIGKLLQVSSCTDDAIQKLDKPTGFFGTVFGSREKDRQLAKLLADAVHSLGYVIEQLKDRRHVAALVADGKLDAFLQMDDDHPDDSILRESLKVYADGREFLVNGAPSEVLDLLQWNRRRIQQDHDLGLPAMLSGENRDAYNQWSASLHEAQEVRDYLYQNFSVSEISR
jgi:hypothetical protein